MDDVLVGIIAVMIGAAACFYGLRLWFALLPIWGFVAGFFVGAAAVTAIFGDGFLSTVTGWVVGFFVGLGFGLLSYFIWYIGVLIAAGSVGAAIGSGIGRALTIDAEWLLFILGLAVALLFIAAAFMIALPIYVVIASTASAGAIGITTGAMLILNRIDLGDLDNGPAWALIQDSWFWVLVWAVLLAVGIVYQLRMLTSIQLPEDRWTQAMPPPTAYA